MADGWVLIDTSAWIHALRPSGDPAVRQEIRRVLAEGRGATCEMIILELAAGTRTEPEYRELGEDLEALQQFPITQAVWRSAYGIAHAVRREGVSVPPTDHLIAAVALSYRCHLLHCDKHFDLMARHIGLSVWTS